MKISDFIDGRGVTYDTVRKYIVNHPELFKGHIGRTNNIVLDDAAIEILEKKYPFPDPVQVIQDTEAREKLQALTEKYIKVLEENKLLVEQNAQLLVTQAKQKYLEEENRSLSAELDEGARYAEYLENELEKRKASYEFLQRQFKTVESNLEMEKKKSWWDKLRGR